MKIKIQLTTALALSLGLGSATSFAADAKAPAAKSAAVMKFEGKEENGKKLWLPATSTVKVNEPVTVEIHNSMTAPHGFKIAGYVDPQVIGAGETKTVTFTPTKKGDLKVECQLHPAHVGATIKVQ